MKILLVNPGTEYKPRFRTYAVFPNGLLYMASVLEGAGHEVKVFDNVVSELTPPDYARDFAPDVIGFSVLTGPCIGNALIQSKEFKALLPGVKVVWGNVHATCTTEQTLKEEAIDFVVRGDGEYTLLELVNRLEKGDGDYAGILGIAWKDKEGRITINQPRPFIHNLDELPDPAWHLIDVPKYWDITLNTSRGCPFKCSFCYNIPFHQGHRADLSVERIVSQIEHLQKNYKVKFIRFFEDNFTFNRRRMREFCRTIIERRIKIKWDTESRADMSEEDVALMAKAGCTSVGIGVETGSKRMLEYLNKGIDLDEMGHTFWRFVRHGIMPRLYIMLAVPSETPADFKETQDMLRKMEDPPFMYMRFVPYPGTPLYEELVNNKRIKPPESLEEWAKFSVYFATRGNLSELSDEQITQALSHWAHTYASRRVMFTLRHNPRYLLGAVKNPSEFFKALGSLIKNSLPVAFNKNTNIKPLVLEAVPNRMSGKQEPRLISNYD